jgi:hypothetical protein
MILEDFESLAGRKSGAKLKVLQTNCLGSFLSILPSRESDNKARIYSVEK